LYALLGLPFFYLLTQAIGTEQKPEERTISFSLSQYEPEVIPPVQEPIPEEIIEPKPIEPEPPEEVKEEPIVEEVVPEPMVKKVIKNPVKKKPVIKKKKIVKKKVQKKIKKRVKQASKNVSRKKVQKKRMKAQASKRASPAQKNRFLNQLRGKINRNKAYPRIAQRRGMQGSVKVLFTILRNGRVGNISVSGPKVFHKSAKSAVKKAFPINVKNAPISLPKTVNVTLRYQIR